MPVTRHTARPAAAVAIAVLCLLAGAPRAVHACVADGDRCCVERGFATCNAPDVVCVNGNRCRPCGGLNEFECTFEGEARCDDGFIVASTGRCRPCGGLGNAPCADGPGQSAPGCGTGLTPTAEGRCRPCGASDQLACVSESGTRFCTGPRLIVSGDRCRPCGTVGRSPCEDGEAPCDGTMAPAADDGGACRPCGTRMRACCPAPDAFAACRSAVQQCVDGVCLRCGPARTLDPGCPGT